ncbi:MAG: hypothetical protein RBU23_12550 [Candidatus Auribacterota bacterium]|jgi:hypothetical protein|nr:hypothetical protein [Candidatus Auribacterota bacterium]
MKNLFYAGALLVLTAVFCPLLSATTTIYYQDFEDTSFNHGDSFGNLSGLKNSANQNISFTGGTIYNTGSDKMLKLEGSFPDFESSAAIMVNLNNYFLQSITFNFYFEYITASQEALEIPTILTAEILLVGQGNKVFHNPIYLLNFNYTGIQEGLMDVTPDPSSYDSPFNTSYSTQNKASFTADLSSLSQFISNAGSSIALVVSVLYPDLEDEYDAKVYIDDITVTGVPIPEPSAVAFCFFGGLLLIRIVRKTRS